jgi:hypothetical protein
MFGENVITVDFQSVFYLEIHQNNIFFIFKFFSGFHCTKHNLISYLRLYCINFTANTKTNENNKRTSNLSSRGGSC